MRLDASTPMLPYHACISLHFSLCLSSVSRTSPLRTPCSSILHIMRHNIIQAPSISYTVSVCIYSVITRIYLDVSNKVFTSHISSDGSCAYLPPVTDADLRNDHFPTFILFHCFCVCTMYKNENNSQCQEFSRRKIEYEPKEDYLFL